MRIANKDLHQDLSPFDAGREAYLRGLSVDAGLKIFSVTYKMVDQTASFVEGYDREWADAVEARTGILLDRDDEDGDLYT